MLKSLYLRNIDNHQVKAEYLPLFTFFYNMVSDFNTLTFLDAL
jgi:hypothetical protein